MEYLPPNAAGEECHDLHATEQKDREHSKGSEPLDEDTHVLHCPQRTHISGAFANLGGADHLTSRQYGMS